MQTGASGASAIAANAPQSGRFGGFRPKAAQLAEQGERAFAPALARRWLSRRCDSPWQEASRRARRGRGQIRDGADFARV